jgi:hypothetical protein
MDNLTTSSPAVAATLGRAQPVPAMSRYRLIGWSIVAGLVVAIAWSAKLVDDDIGVNAANGMLGHDTLTTGISGSLAGVLFAFTAGLAGTFTACNVAVFSAVGPLLDQPSRARWRSLGWLAAGMLVVAGVYGAVGAMVGRGIPQLDTALVGGKLEVRTLQSVLVFSVIGIVLIYLGLAAAGAAPDPLASLTRRWPYTPQFVMGGLIGAFLIGRPYPLFYRMFEYAASTHNGFYGALTFILVIVGNALLMAILFLVLSATGFQRWLTAVPGRARRFTAVTLLVAGAFTFAYWGLRVPASTGYGWFPTVTW